MEPAFPQSAAGALAPQRLVSPILRELPMYTKIMEVLDDAPSDGDHGALVKTILQYEKLLLSFVGSSAKIHDSQCLLGIEIQNVGGKARVVATQASPNTWTAKQALEVVDVTTLYKVVDALALAKDIAPRHTQFPLPVPLTESLPVAAKSVVDKLLDISGLIKSFKKGISKITSPVFDEGHVIPSVGLLKALHRLDDSKDIMKIQRNFLLAAAHIAYMQDFMRPPAELVEGAEVPDVTFEQFRCRLDQSVSKEEAKYLERLNKHGAIALRFPLQLALFLSPLVLLIAMALEKKMFDRNHLIRLARALGTDRPPSVIQVEKNLWVALFALIKNPSSSTKTLEDLANALPHDVSAEATNWFRERLTLFQHLPPSIAPIQDKPDQVPVTAVFPPTPALQNTQIDEIRAAVLDAPHPKASSASGPELPHSLSVNEQTSSPIMPVCVPQSAASPRLRELDQQAGGETVNYSNPSSPRSPCPDDDANDGDLPQTGGLKEQAEGEKHGEVGEASPSQKKNGGKDVEQEDGQEGHPQNGDVQPQADEGQDAGRLVQHQKEKEGKDVGQEDGQEESPVNEDVQVDEPSQLEKGGQEENEREEVEGQEEAEGQEAEGLVQQGHQDPEMDVDEEVNQPEASNKEMDVELDAKEPGGNEDVNMDVDEEVNMPERSDSESREEPDLDQEENDNQPDSDEEQAESDVQPDSEDQQNEQSGSGKPPLRRSSRQKNPVPPQPDPSTPANKPHRKPKPKPVEPELKQSLRPSPSRQTKPLQKLGQSSTRKSYIQSDFDPEPAKRYEGNQMFLITPDGYHFPVIPKMNLPEDLACLESFYDAVLASYKNGRPLHSQIKPRVPGQPEDALEYVVDERSCLAHYTYESFSKATTRELQEVFRHKHIMVTGCPYEERHFDAAGAAYLEKRLSSIISAHDHSIPVEDGDYSVREIKLTFQEFIDEMEKPDGHILNGLNFPLSVRGGRVTQLSTCVEAFTATKGLPHCPDEVPFPISDFNWALATHAFSHHDQHMDTAGVNTLFEGNCGCKWVVVARRPLSAKRDPFASNSAFGEQFSVAEPMTKEWEYEAVLLRPGDMFFMRANTIHFVFTPENSIFHGSHFYTTSTLRETLYALTHCLMGDIFLTNTSHPKGILLLLRILHYCHEEFIIQKADFDNLSPHIPDLRAMDGYMDLVHLCSIVLFFNVLDPRTYQLEPESNSLSEQRYLKYDRNGVSSEDRLCFAYARGLACELLDWVDATFVLEAPPGSTEDSLLGCREFFAREALHHGLYIVNYRRKVQTEDQERRRREAEENGWTWDNTGLEHPEQLLELTHMTCTNVMQQVAWALLTLPEITSKRWEQAMDKIEEVHYMVADQEQVMYTPKFREDVEEVHASWKVYSPETRYGRGKTQGDEKYFAGQTREFSAELRVNRGAEALHLFKKRYAGSEVEVPCSKRRCTRK